MYRNVASQKIALFAFTTSTGAAKTGDAANLTAYVSKDAGAVTVLGDTSATEMDATNAPGWYLFDLTQGETDAVDLLFTGKSSTSGVAVVGRPISTLPNRMTALVIDSNGLADATAVKLGPSGSATAQTARDVGASVLVSSGTGTGQLDVTSGVVKSNIAQILGTALTETAGQIAAAFKKLFDVATPVLTAQSVNQTGDNYARLGAPAGASVSADIAAVKADTSAISGYVDTEVAAIKAKTDQLTFTKANELDVNIQSVNDVTVNGTGAPGSEWGP